MRFLVDEALSPVIASKLTEAGHDTVHVRDAGLQSASDKEIFLRTAREDRILISADTDFGAILAELGVAKPSVIILRQAPKRPDAQAALLLANLPDLEEPLHEGCVATFVGPRVRIRYLPIK
ncbi:MAG: DUF5615 family PIN-like protein [Thermoleophilia bacterium]|nr:DUF5615 family PIN-like protein [Thermoleophilia bacterium]